MTELKFATVEEAAQHLADLTGKQVRVALMGPVDPKLEQELKKEVGLLFKKSSFIRELSIFSVNANLIWTFPVFLWDSSQDQLAGI